MGWAGGTSIPGLQSYPTSYRYFLLVGASGFEPPTPRPPGQNPESSPSGYGSSPGRNATDKYASEGEGTEGDSATRPVPVLLAQLEHANVQHLAGVWRVTGTSTRFRRRGSSFPRRVTTCLRRFSSVRTKCHCLGL